MRPISDALKTHLQGTTLTICTLWQVTLQNGTVLGFTDHDQNIIYSGVTYLAASGYSKSALANAETLGVNNSEVHGLLVSPAITEDALLAGLWDYASLQFFLINWADTTMGALELPGGTLGQVTKLRDSFIAELRGKTQNLQQSLGRIYTPACDADLGDTRCTVNLTSFTVTGTVGSVSSNRIINDGGRIEANGYFDQAKLTFTSGLNNGLSMEVKSYVVGQLSLSLQMYYAIAPGDTYNVYAGCDKQRSTCVNKFNNVINFRGFPDLPGQDRLTKVIAQ